MNCARGENAVFLHAHGQLQGFRRLLVETHLERCDTCRAKWARWVVEKDALRRSFSPMPIIDSPAQRLMDMVGVRIRSERPDHPPGRHAPAAWALAPAHRTLALAGVVLVLAATVSALAAFWQPSPPCPESNGAGAPVLPVANGQCTGCHATLPANHPPLSPTALPAAPSCPQPASPGTAQPTSRQ
jgi:anti-sigma factor RsiW